MSTNTQPKYHKSCDYCRYRKVKCQKIENTDTCRHCEACSVPCKYSLKEKSQKRRIKSAKIAASIQDKSPRVEQQGESLTIDSGLNSFLAGITAPTPPQLQHTQIQSFFSPESNNQPQQTQHVIANSPATVSLSPQSFSSTSPPEQSNQYSHHRSLSLDDTKYRTPNANANTNTNTDTSNDETIQGNVKGMTNPSSNPKISTSKRSVRDIYKQFVQPFTPFLPDSLILDDIDTDLSQLCKCCISLSALTSADYMTPDATTELLLEVCNNILQQETEWDENTIASVFLLASRSTLPGNVVQRCIKAFSTTIIDNSKIILGAIAADAWTALVENRPPAVDPKILTNFDFYLQEIDNSTFGYYFLSLSQILLRCLFSFHEIPCTASSPLDQNSREWVNQRYRYLQLESDLLMWPIRLPKHLTVVKDELIAPNEAVILHVLHNTATLALYNHALKNRKTYGHQIAVAPVPGLLQFCAGMAKSTFKCGGHLYHRWPILRQLQVLNAEYMLALYESTEYEFCKRALSWWIDDQVDPPLFKRVKDLLGDTDWAEHSDGAVVFWVYRDVRSMSIDVLLSDASDRLSA